MEDGKRENEEIFCWRFEGNNLWSLKNYEHLGKSTDDECFYTKSLITEQKI